MKLMRRKIPRTELLVAFEASARHQSFTRAAEELSLTQSAICKQIAALEAYLGVSLFYRIKKRIVLSEAGQIYAGQVTNLLKQVEQDTLSLMANRGAGGVVELAILPTFATHWLIPRLPRFHAEHPEIIIDLTTRTEPFIFVDTPFKAAINSDPTVWPGTSSDFLFCGQTIPVCNPFLLKGRKKLNASELLEFPLLHQSIRLNAWREWFESAGLKNANPMGGARYELLSMLMEAAKAGLGIILVPRFFVSNELSSGQLVCPCPHALPDKRLYYLIYPDDEIESTPYRLFRNWLCKQAAEFRETME